MAKLSRRSRASFSCSVRWEEAPPHRCVSGRAFRGAAWPSSWREISPTHGRASILSVWWSLWQADAVLVTDRATLRAVPRALRGKAVVWPDICAPSGWASCKRCRAADGLLVLFSGSSRVFGRKSTSDWLPSANSSSTHRRRGIPSSDRAPMLGTSEDKLKRSASRPTSNGSVRCHTSRWPPSTPPTMCCSSRACTTPVPTSSARRSPRAYRSSHSISGSPGVTIDRRCGVAVATNGRSRAEIVSELAAHLRQLHASPELRAHLSDGARERANELSVSQRVRDLVERHY